MSNPFAVTTVRCAGPDCQAVRREVNHWWAVVMEDSFECYPLPATLKEYEKPVCGQECAHKLLSQYMSEVK